MEDYITSTQIVGHYTSPILRLGRDTWEITIKNITRILDTDTFNVRDTNIVAIESVLTYIQKKHPYILGDALFHTSFGMNAEMVHEYKRLRFVAGAGLIARELYRLPNSEWVLRTHRGSIARPRQTVYLKIDADSARALLEGEIRHAEYEDTKEILRKKIKRYFPT